jgi:hypothetical protein
MRRRKEILDASSYRLPHYRPHIALWIAFTFVHVVGVQARGNRAGYLISGLHNRCVSLALACVASLDKTTSLRLLVQGRYFWCKRDY